jgi:hypothetical protein
MIQGFTTDPKLLRATLEKVPVATPPTGPESSPSDPDAASIFPEQSVLDRDPGTLMNAVRDFEHDGFFYPGGSVFSARWKLCAQSLAMLRVIPAARTCCG